MQFPRSVFPAALLAARLGALLLVAAVGCMPAVDSASRWAPTPRRQLTHDIGSPWGTRLSPNGRSLAFTLPRHGSQAIFVVATDGGDPKQLTAWEYRSWRPSWSPDGRQLAFASNRAGAVDIWVMSAAGEKQRRLTTEETVEEDPAWSPDGKWIAYASNRSGNYNLWMVPAGGGEPVQLTRRTTGHAWAVAWARDSRRITFMANWDSADARGHVWTAPIDGGAEPQQLTRGAGRESQPAWSPDGQWIAFTSDHGGQFDLWMIPAAGGEPIQLTDDDAVEDFPTWSRDGRSMAYDTGRISSVLWRVSAGGGPSSPLNVAQRGEWLTQTAEPDYSPDGSRIAFQSYAKRNRDIWIASADGSTIQQMTSDSADDMHPSWSPDGRSLAFTSSRGGALDIWIAETAGEPARRLTRLGTARRPAWCRGGSLIVFDAEQEGGLALWMVAAAGGEAERLPAHGASHADCSPSSDLIAFERQLGTNIVEISLLALGDRTVSEVTSFGKRSGSPRWSPDGRRLAFLSNKDGPQDLYVKEVASGDVVRLTDSEDIESRAAWSPDGSTIVYGAASNTRDIWILDVAASIREISARRSG